jgi:hypothetical protein
MTDEETTAASDTPGPPAQATDTTAASDAEAVDLAKRLKAVVAELETGVATEPGDLLSPSEKLRAIADLIDRRAATAAPPTGR